MSQLCICDDAASRPQKADDLLVMLLSAVVASQKGRSSLLTKGNAAAKAILRAFFDSAHSYAAQHFAHTAASSCICLACLGCHCSACDSAETEQEAASDSSGDEGNASDSDGDEDEAKSECELCGKRVKDLARHMKRLHAAANATDSDRDDDAADERKQWQARLEAAEQAEQKAADLARRAQREKAVAEAKAMAASAPSFAAQPPFAAPASAVVEAQPDAGAETDDSSPVRAPSPDADVDPASSSVKNASEQPFAPAALSLPVDIEPEQPQQQHEMSLVWAEREDTHDDTHASWQRSHQQRQWAREQVAQVGQAIQTHMVGALSSPAAPSSSALDVSSLQTMLSFAPGRESAALAPLQAVALYQDQWRFGRKIDLTTRFVAGRLARSFYAHEGGPNVKQAAAARRTAASGAALDFEAFCVRVLGAYARVVRAEIWFAALCDLSPGLLPALCRHAELFRWADFTLHTALFFEEWKSWLSHNGFLQSLTAPSARASLPLVCPHCGAKVAQQATLARHVGPNPPQSCLNKRAKPGSTPDPEPESPQDAKASAKRKPSDDDAPHGAPKKARLEEGEEDSSEAKADEAAPCPLATVHLQTIRRYDAPLLRISDVVDTPAFRTKQLLPVRFSEAAFRSALESQRPYLATDVPVTYRGKEALPSSDELLAQLRATIGRTIEKVDVYDGETRSEHLYVKAAFDTWHASGSQYLPPDELGNMVNGKAETFVRRFAFGGGLDSSNALREQKKDLRAVTLSPRGAFTNTHWDEYAAVTFYLAGLKLWIFADADEAKQYPGVRDTSSLPASTANSPDSFSLSDFCRMRKAWWALTGAGQLVACPAGLLHRVVTLEKTFGVTFNYEPRTDA